MLWFILAFAIIVAIAFMPGSTPKLDPRRYPQGISALEQVSIQGSRQWVLIRSENVHNPVLLFVHGGPGTSMLGLTRRNTRALERDFTVVNWDQRGAGKSFAVGLHNANMRVFVADVIALASYLAERFHQDKIVLVGHSWGSAIGLLAAARRPDLFAAYIGIGQMSDAERSEAMSYAWTLDQAEARKDTAGLTKLREIGPPPYTGSDWRKKFMTQRSLLARYGGELHGSALGAFGAVARNLCAREYSMRDRWNYFRGILHSVAVLGPEMFELNLFEEVPSVELPVYFCLGRHDYEVPSELSAAYFQALRAPYKHLEWFDDSGHLPNSEQPDDFNRFMLQTVRPALGAKVAPPLLAAQTSAQTLRRSGR